MCLHINKDLSFSFQEAEEACAAKKSFLVELKTAVRHFKYLKEEIIMIIIMSMDRESEIIINKIILIGIDPYDLICECMYQVVRPNKKRTKFYELIIL